MTAVDRQTARGWEQEVPLYKATRDVNPSPNDRVRFEAPFSSQSNPDAYQYSERPIAAGQLVETKNWPHPSFRPLNRSAEAVMEFFTTRQKSRMSISPWNIDRIVLEDGLSGRTQPNIKIGATAK
jgi:hypothetical protein